MIDTAHVQRWLDAYVDAWSTYDPAAIGMLFTDDAEYRWHPWDTGGENAVAVVSPAITPAPVVRRWRRSSTICWS